MRHALDQLRSESVAESSSSATAEISYREQVEDNVIEAELTWRHRSNGTVSQSRMLAFADTEGRPRVVRAECVIADDAADLQQTCGQALGTLATAASNQQHWQLGEIEASQAPALKPSVEVAEADLELHSSPSFGAAPKGSPRVLYSGPPSANDNHRGRLWVIAGLVLLAGAGWLGWRAKAKNANHSGSETKDRT